MYSGNRAIRKIEAFDQNIYGTGGYLAQINGGISNVNATLEFSSSIPGGSIDFLVNIFAEGDNNFSVGEITNSSILLTA